MSEQSVGTASTTRRAFGLAMLGLGFVLGTLGILLTLTLVLAPVGLPLVLVGLGLAVPGALMSGSRRAGH